MISYFTALSIWFPLLIGLKKFSKYESKVKVFVFYLILIAVVEHISIILSIKCISNLFVYNIIDLVTMLLVAFYLNEKEKVLAFLSWSLFTLTLLIAFIKTPIKTAQINFIIIYSFIGISGLYLIYKSIKNDAIPFLKTFDFWVKIGFVVCAILTVIIMAFFDLIVDPTLGPSLVHIHNYGFFIATFLQYLFFSIALLCRH